MSCVTYVLPTTFATALKKSGVSESVAVIIAGSLPLLSCLYSDMNVAVVWGSADQISASGLAAITLATSLEYEDESAGIVRFRPSLPPSLGMADSTPGRLP